MIIVYKQTILMKYHALFVIFEKAAKNRHYYITRSINCVTLTNIHVSQRSNLSRDLLNSFKMVLFFLVNFPISE